MFLTFGYKQKTNTMKKAIQTFIGIVFTAAVVSCGSTKEVDPIAIITSTNWELKSINGKNAAEAGFAQGVPTITFTTANKVMGKGGCNSYSGSYNLNDEGGVNFSQVASTKMACENMAGETEFFATLDKANMTKIDADKLTLMNGLDEIMVFVPKK